MIALRKAYDAAFVMPIGRAAIRILALLHDDPDFKRMYPPD